jgi:hypothetical protein
LKPNSLQRNVPFNWSFIVRDVHATKPSVVASYLGRYQKIYVVIFWRNNWTVHL